jgi:GntR family transcriptional regulator
MYLSINESDPLPLYLQIVSQIKQQVRKGTLKRGDELPAVRELAKILRINMHTVRSAYLKLREEGIVNLRLGSRATIAKLPQLVDKHGIENYLQSQVKEVITDALLSGLPAHDIRNIVETELKQMDIEIVGNGSL